MINAHKLFINMAMDKQRKNASNQKPLALKTPSNRQAMRQNTRNGKRRHYGLCGNYTLPFMDALI